jgi:hypothetical protein
VIYASDNYSCQLTNQLLKKQKMKKQIIIALIAVMGLGFTFSSCNKYEDGPKFSLLTKKARLTGDWTLEAYIANGYDITSTTQSFLGASWEYQIEKDGSWKQTGNMNSSGTWELGEDKDDVKFTETSPGNNVTTYRILKLKSKELWLRYTNSNGTYDIMHLKQ